jgi:hypothetical protein
MVVDVDASSLVVLGVPNQMVYVRTTVAVSDANSRAARKVAKARGKSRLAYD